MSTFATATQRRRALTAYGFLAPYLLFFLVFQLIPLLTTIGLAFMKWELLEGTRHFVGLDNFRSMAGDELWWISLRNSFYFSAITTAAITLLALAVAVALRSVQWGQAFFRVIFYAPVILSVTVIGVIWSRLLNNDGFINYYLARVGIMIPFLSDANLVIPSLSLATLWWGFGFPMLVFLAGLYAIPEAVYEAAQIDGATPWVSFTRVTLPLLRPALLLVLVTQFLGHLQVFGQSYTITDGGPGYASYMVIQYMYQTAWKYYHMGYAGAMAIVLAVIMLTVALIQFRLLGQRVEY